MIFSDPSHNHPQEQHNSVQSEMQPKTPTVLLQHNPQNWLLQNSLKINKQIYSKFTRREIKKSGATAF